MRTMSEWFEEYSVSHQNPKNKAIHYVCVPAIYFSVVGMLMCLRISFFVFPFPFFGSIAFPVLVFVMLFYFRISKSMAIKMLIFSMFCIIINLVLARFVNLFYSSLLIFALAWIGQFYGHQLEGKKPSFLKDLQFLMIGPAWVIENLFQKN